MKSVYDVIIRPVITEQSMEDLDIKKFAFEVAKDATKIEVKKAVEEIFGVTVVKVGDRVIGSTGHGAFAEKVLVSANKVVPLPAGVDYDVAAAFTLTYGTSYHALADRAAAWRRRSRSRARGRWDDSSWSQHNRLRWGTETVPLPRDRVAACKFVANAECLCAPQVLAGR